MFVMPAKAQTQPIPVRSPFDFRFTLAFLRGFSPMMGEQRVTADTLVKSWIVRRQPITVSICAEKKALTCQHAEVDDATARTVRERVASFVSADENLDPFYEIAARDRAFAPVAKRLRGFHHPRFGTPFEAACWSVLNQRVQRSQARMMKAALVTRFGAKDCDAFPEASSIAPATEKEIGDVLNRRDRKARAVWSVAQAFATVDEKWLQSAPIADVHKWLLGIYGVGAFAAGFICFRGLGRATGLPWGDAFVSAAQKTYRGATRATLEKHAAKYGEFMGHWSLYLWANTFV